jgi:CHAT domain-containing protein/tetratricopeptide (TPR) repeat protein
MHKFLMSVWFAILIIPCSPLVNSLAQPREGDEAIRNLLENLLTAFAQGDLDGVMAKWSKQSPQLDQFKRFAQNVQSIANGLQATDVRFTRWKVEADRASVRLGFSWKYNDRQTGKPAHQELIWEVLLVRESGAWKVWERRQPLVEFANALVKAKTKAERAQLLAAERDLVSGRLSQLFNNTSEQQAKQGHFEDALRFSDIALEVADVLEDNSRRAWCYISRGEVFRHQSRYPSALENYQSALSLFRTAKDKVGEARTLNSIGGVHLEMHKPEEALGFLKASVEAAKAADDKQTVAYALNNIGGVYRAAEQYSEALNTFLESAKIAREIGDDLQIARALGNGGITFLARGEYPAAADVLLECLKILQELKDDSGEGRWLTAKVFGDLGRVQSAVGKYAAALAHYETGLQIFREIGDKGQQADLLMQIANVYRMTGNYRDASAKFDESFRIAAETKNEDLLLKTLSGAAGVYYETGAYDKAATLYELTRELAKQAGLKRLEAEALSSSGVLYDLSNNKQEALTRYEQGLKLTRELGMKTAEAATLANIGGVYADLRKYAEAVDAYQSALKLLSIYDLEIVAKCFWGIGNVYREQKQWQLAVDAYKQSIQRIELMRTQTREQSLQTSFFRQYVSPYYSLAKCLLEMKSELAEAFAFSEQAKARTLVDIFQSGRVDVLKETTAAEQQEEKRLNAAIFELTARFNELQKQTAPDKKQSEAARQQLEKARGDYAEFRRRLFLQHPDLQAQRAQFEPVQLARLNRTLLADNPNLCLLSYLVGSEDTLLFVITRGKDAQSPAALSVYKLPIKESDLIDKVKQFRQQCGALGGRSRSGPEVARADLEDGPQKSSYQAAAKALYKLLLEPAGQALTGKSHLVIIPDGALNTLPFQALIDGQNKHLIESRSLNYAPSVTALVKMSELAESRRKEAGNQAKTLLAIGRPWFGGSLRDLPASESEVQRISELYQTQPLVGKAATNASVKAAMPTAQFIHFATHGLLNETEPMYSAIALTKDQNDDGMLYARELLDLNLRAEMVVLSACETALGEEKKGEGVLGLTWALFVAGTPTSVVTQWSVADASTSTLMIEFYRQMKATSGSAKAAASKAEALRQAQLKLMKDGKHSHPYYWAPFILVGDWRN